MKNQNPKSEPNNPVIVYEMIPGMEGNDGVAYGNGGRFKIETIHNERHYAKTNAAMEWFLARHGCYSVTPEQMETLRAERVQKSKRKR